jgi:Flp pilus assembly protein TadG
VSAFLKNRKGYVMAYMVMLLITVGLPMLVLSVEITRAMYVEVQLQSAVDAACDAAIQAVDLPTFINTGVLQVSQGEAASYAAREFSATVARHNINNYNPALTGLSFPTATVVQCSGSASMNWFIPGIPALSLSASSMAQAKVSL